MLYLLKDPEPEADVVPGSKEQTGDERSDVRRDAKEVVEASNNTEVDKIIQPHKQDEPYDLLARLAFARFVVEHPLFVHEEEQYMR